jgi:hypothetical protein
LAPDFIFLKKSVYTGFSSVMCHVIFFSQFVFSCPSLWSHQTV